MVKLNPFYSSPNSEDPTTILPCSYTPLPHGPLPADETMVPASRQRPTKEILLVFSGLLMLGFFVSIIGESGGDLHIDVDGSLSRPGKSPASFIPVETLEPLSRGVSAGVSEKANLKSFGLNAASFDWNNSMLSWQRTAFHFQPEKNWMNDPNGPLFYKGWYHFFYQYNPHGAMWGDIVWGHAVSKDLIHWLHLPFAMVPDQWYDINGVWTGSATLLPDGQIMMLYTGSTNQSVQVQNLAYPSNLSDPLLINWVKSPSNPVLLPPPGIHFKDFRDPTTAWLTSQGKWRLTIGSMFNRTGISLVYETEDFVKFELLDRLLHAVDGTGMWECVDFFPVSKFEENGLDTSANGPEVKHVIKASFDDDRHDYYSIGSYDEELGRWVPDFPEFDIGKLRYDYGIFYASKTFYDQNKGRRVLWGWIGESDSESSDVQKGWASVQSIPRTLVYDKKTGSNLLQWPVEEVESLRLSSHNFKNIELKPGSMVPLDIKTATQLDIVAEFELEEDLERVNGSNADEYFSCSSSGGASQRGALGPFGLLVLADGSLSEQTPVYFYVSKGINGTLQTFFCSDQSRSSDATDVNKQIYGSIVPVLKDEKFSLRILVDHSIVESFAQGGRRCITSRVYPTKAIYGAAKLFLFNNATHSSVTSSLQIWQMNSAFIQQFHPENHK